MPDSVAENYKTELNAISDGLSGFGAYGENIIEPGKIMEDAIEGKLDLSSGNIIAAIIKELLESLTENVNIIVLILGICILSAIAVNVVGRNNSLAEMNESVPAMAVAILLCGLFLPAVKFATDAACGMESVSVSMIPLIAALGLRSGSTVFVATAQYVSIAVCWFFIPLAVLYGGLGLCECLTDDFPIADLKNGIKSVFVWGLGLTMTVFFCVTAVTGAVSGQFSGVAGKTVKYAGNLIPFVGSYLSESADLVFSGLSSLKSAAGIGTAAAVFITGISPFIKLFAFTVLLRISAFAVAPFGNARIKQVINSITEAMTMLMGLVGLIGVFFIINIAMFTSVNFA